MRDQRLDLHLSKIDADADTWPTAETHQRIWRFVLFARRRKAIRVKPIGVGKNCWNIVRAGDRVKHMRAGWNVVAAKFETLQHPARPIRDRWEQPLGLAQRVLKQLHTLDRLQR